MYKSKYFIDLETSLFTLREDINMT